MTVYDHYAAETDGAYSGAGYSEQNAAYNGDTPEARGGVLTWIGGVASLALIAGLAMWTYDLILRDVAGVPVIEALDGPMRVQPETPGGSQADYQGLAVNQVQAAGVAADAPAQIMLAPRPLDLSDATPPSTTLAVAPGDGLTEAQVMQAVYAPQDEMTEQLPEQSNPVNTGLAVEALLNELVAEQDAMSALIPASVPGVTRSPRPEARPAAVRVASLTPRPTVPVQPSAATFADPTTLTPGTRMVQFRAYGSEAEARAAFDAINAEFAEYMVGKTPVILPSSDGSSTFYRLRMTGFADMAEAQRFCAVFEAASRDCVPLQF